MRKWEEGSEFSGIDPGSLPGRSSISKGYIGTKSGWQRKKPDLLDNMAAFLGVIATLGEAQERKGQDVPNSASQYPTPQHLFSSKILGFSPTCSPRSQGPGVHPFKSHIPFLNPRVWLLAPRCVCNVAIRAGPCLLPTLKFWQIWGGVGAGLWENRGLLVVSEEGLEDQLGLEMG